MSHPSTRLQRRGLKALTFVLALTAAICAMAFAVSMFKTVANPQITENSIDMDFSVFWGAARLAQQGRWIDAFTEDHLSRARELVPGRAKDNMLWFYPPTFHLMLAPLGSFNFAWAWLVFTGTSLALFALALLRQAWPLPNAWLLTLTAPITVLCFVLGQNTLLLAALFVTGLAATRRGNWAIAGLAFALMTIKPQLGVLIPIALLAGGHWRVVAWAALATAVLVGGTLIFPGLEYWQATWAAISHASDVLLSAKFKQSLMIGWYTALSFWGLPQAVAITAQAVIGTAAALAVGWIWSRRDVAPMLQNAALAFGILLATPYAHYYESLFALLGGLFLALAGPGLGWGRVLIIAAVWVGPIAAQFLRDSIGYTFYPVVNLAALTAIMVWSRAGHAAPAAIPRGAAPSPG